MYTRRRRPPLCTRQVDQFHTFRIRVPRNSVHARCRVLSQGVKRRVQDITWWSNVTRRSSGFLFATCRMRSAACDPRFCARRGPTAFPFPPAAPQAPRDPCSPPSTVLWPNLTSRSSSGYGIVPFLCDPSTTVGQDLPGPCFSHGSQTPRSPCSPHQTRLAGCCLRPGGRPRHSGFTVSRGSIARLAAPQRFA